MPDRTPARPPRRRWTLGRLMIVIGLFALVLAPFAWLVRERRVAVQAQMLAALRAEQMARDQAEQLAIVARDAMTAGRMEESAPPSGPEPPAVDEGLRELRAELQRLRRRVAELEARVPAFPNPKPVAHVRAEGGLTPPAKPD